MHQEFRVRGPRVLIVDDHGISRQFMAAALRHIAGDIKQACTASEARALAWSWLPDLILMDVRLADTDGFEVARQIRSRWPLTIQQPRVIMLSAQPCRAGRPRIDRAGMDGFLTKPVTMPELFDAIAAPTNSVTRSVDEDSLSQLQALFRCELAARLEPLEGCLTSCDFAGARAILHQLIASSGLCLQRRLERDLRALHEACDKRPHAGSLARNYFSLLVRARKYLQSTSLAMRD
jgi:CheY-like chemotaxis protein